MVGEKNDALRWVPLSLDGVLRKYGFTEKKSVLLIISWVILTGLSMLSLILMIPESWVSANINDGAIRTFFFFYPPLIIGALLLFWLGFEWGFVPIFLSSFMIAISASMGVVWSLLFSISFVFGLAIFALAYHCVEIGIEMRSIRQVAFFVIVSLIASMTGSLGSFVWSFSQGLTPIESFQIWNGWWTGTFFQSILIIGPMLGLLSPTIMHYRDEWFELQKPPKVTLKWIYGSISSVVAGVSLFIIGGKILGGRGVEYALSGINGDVLNSVMLATESFHLIFWLSLGLVVLSGFSGIYLISTWNKSLREEVDEKTKLLLKSEKELRKSLKSRNLLLHELHGKVKKNLSIILAMLELQLNDEGDDALKETLKHSKSRIRSISLIHEQLSGNGTLEEVNLKSYLTKLINRLEVDYNYRRTGTEVNIKADEIKLQLEQAVSVCMILNEILNKFYKLTEKYQAINSKVELSLSSDKMNYYFMMSDDGSLIQKLQPWYKSSDIGVRLIRALNKQLQGELLFDEQKNSLVILIPKECDKRDLVDTFTGSNQSDMFN